MDNKDNKDLSNLLIWLAIVIFVLFLVWGMTGQKDTYGLGIFVIACGTFISALLIRDEK